MKPSDSLHHTIGAFYESYSLSDQRFASLQEWGAQQGLRAYSIVDEQQLQRARRYRWIVLWLGLMFILVVVGMLLQRFTLRYASAAQHRSMWEPLLSWHQQQAPQFKTNNILKLKQQWPHLPFRPIASVHMPKRLWQLVGSSVMTWQYKPVLFLLYVRRSDGVRASVLQSPSQARLEKYFYLSRRINSNTSIRTWRERGLFFSRLGPH